MLHFSFNQVHCLCTCLVLFLFNEIIIYQKKIIHEGFAFWISPLQCLPKCPNMPMVQLAFLVDPPWTNKTRVHISLVMSHRRNRWSTISLLDLLMQRLFHKFSIFFFVIRNFFRIFFQAKNARLCGLLLSYSRLSKRISTHDLKALLKLLTSKPWL